MAVGASTTAIRQRLLTRAASLAGVGTLLGLGLAVAAAQVLRSLVFGMPSFDRASFVLVPTGLLLVALAASWLPASRAVRISPSVVLRGD